MARGRSRLTAVLAGVSLVVCACSSSGSGQLPSTGAPASSPSSPLPTADSGESTAQAYLDTVNRLCDALLPKVIKVTHGGSLDVPVNDYLAQQPAHAQLLAEFDRQLARVPVPPAARGKAAVFAAYVRFATLLDAQRLAAAKHGAAAYAREVRSESIESDPAITALSAAGFDDSCQAR